MNLRTTLALLVLAATGGAVLWVGASLPPGLNPMQPQPAIADSGSRAFLEHLDPAKLTRIEIVRGDRPAVVLQRSGSDWTLPGNWQVNPVPVKEVVDRVGSLRPRFEAEPIADAPIGNYGLDRPAVVVKLETADSKHTLAFARKPAETGVNAFTQETYVRVDDKPEVLRLGPGLIEELDRPVDYYQQRRLFPSKRTAKDDNNREKVERLAGKSVMVEDGKEGGSKFAIAQTAEGWELSAPARDRLEPKTRDAMLTAVPDLWAERFVESDLPAAAAVPAALNGGLPGLLSGLFWVNVNTPAKAPHWLLTRAGLDAPERTLTVTGDDGRPVALLIGKSAGTRLNKVMRPPPPGVPAPPMEVEEPEEFLYAKLKDNDQIFEIKAEKLKDVFVAVDALRDPQVAHFNSADAIRLEIKQGGQEIVLVKDKDKDRWSLEKPLHADADRQKVTDLLNRLSGLEARGKDVIDGADAKTYGLDQPAVVATVTVEEKVKDADEAKEKGKTKTRGLTFRLGKHDDATMKVYVQLEGWPRVNAVTDGGSPGDAGLSALATREAREYRGKRLFDFATGELAKISVQRGNDPTFLFQQADEGTLFFDEVSELSLECQAKLLRVIEGKSFHPLGAKRDVKADVRIVAATHRDLEAEVKAGRFRADLYFRLKVIEIRVPPLREHLEDTPELANFFLAKISAECRRSFRLAPLAMVKLQAYSWPGNVRQLRAAIESAAVMSESDLLDADAVHLAGIVGYQPEVSSQSIAALEMPPGLNMDDIETWAIHRALRQTTGNVSHAAKLLGMSRDTLHTKIKKKSIDRDALMSTPEPVGAGCLTMS